MASIDDYANGAEQTRYHRNPPEECERAVWLVCSYAHDADDALELCTVLGLNPRDGRQKSSSRLAITGSGLSVPTGPHPRAARGSRSGNEQCVRDPDRSPSARWGEAHTVMIGGVSLVGRCVCCIGACCSLVRWPGVSGVGRWWVPCGALSAGVHDRCFGVCHETAIMCGAGG
ncbi:MAG: hypothetical protein ACRDTF_05515, partial [Pseudonocardiaceae bacterium]